MTSTMIARTTRGEMTSRTDPPEWLALIWAANTIDPALFGEPESTGPWWAGGTVEEYAQARLVKDEGSVRFIAKTEHAATVLRTAAHGLGLHTG